MTPAEQDALRDLLRNAERVRERAAAMPKDPPGCGIGSARFRLLLGACDLERAACFLYWRSKQREAA